jgi:hypothetical protein
MDALFSLFLFLIIGIVAWCVGSEGAWGAMLTFLCVLFAGLLTMNFFEPLAAAIENNGGNFLAPYSDLLAFLGLFAGFTFLGRAATEQISPTDIELDGRVYQAIRWIFAAATGYLTMAILCTAIHTAPLPREFIGFRPERANLLEITAPDRQWLGFSQYVSEKILSTGRIFDGTEFSAPRTDQKVWPSFPIRYATRRQELAAGGPRRTVAPSTTAPATPTGPSTPASF